MNADAKKHAAAFGWFGICAGVAFCFMWLACYGADSSWEWGTNALSDFGVSDTDAATYFEWGCVISAILLAFFGVGEALNDKRKSGYLAEGILLALAGICLIFVGFYDSDYEGGDIHEFFAVLAATLFAFAAASWAAQTWYDGKWSSSASPSSARSVSRRRSGRSSASSPGSSGSSSPLLTRSA